MSNIEGKIKETKKNLLQKFYIKKIFWEFLIFSFLALTCLIYGCISDNQNNDDKNYIMLFNFSNSLLNKKNIASKKMIETINESPYDGVIATLTSRNYEAPSITEVSIEEAVAELKKYCHKDIWPVCALTWIVQHNDGRCHSAAKGKNPEMKEIPGIDLDNETGRLKKFYDIWNETLKIAKTLKSPGVVFDLEMYNDYRMDYIDQLSARRGENVDETVRKLESIGAEMAKFAGNVYPGCQILFIGTGLDKPFDKYTASSSHVMLGILKETKKDKIPLRIIAGGEENFGYIYSSIKSMQEKIRKRWRIYAPYLKEYPNLELAGRIAFFVDKKNRPPWMINSKIQFPYSSAEEFVPMMKELLRSYRFVWVYAAWKAYMPWFSPEWSKKQKEPYLSQAMRINTVVTEARKGVRPKSPPENNSTVPFPFSRFSIEDAISSGAKIYFEFCKTERLLARDINAPVDIRNVIIDPEKDTGPNRFTICVKYPEWKEKDGKYKWPGFSILPFMCNLSQIRGIIFAVKNISSSASCFSARIIGNKKEFFKKIFLNPGESRLVIFKTSEMENYIDIKNIKAISFTMTRPRKKAEILFSDLYYFPLESSDNHAERNLLESENMSDWEGMLKFNTQFKRSGKGSFELYGNYPTELISSRMIPVDMNKSYTLSAWMRTLDKKLPASGHLGLRMYDKNKTPINNRNVAAYPGTESTLLSDAVKGTRELLVAKNTKWLTTKYSAVAFKAREKYEDLPNFDISPRVEKVIDMGKEYKVILRKPLEKNYSAGTRVRLHAPWQGPFYWAASGWMPTEWKQFSNTMKGEAQSGAVSNKFWRGTKFVRIFVWFGNYKCIPEKGAKLLVDDIRFSERKSDN